MFFLDYLEGWFSIFRKGTAQTIFFRRSGFWIVSIIVVALISLLLLLNSLYKSFKLDKKNSSQYLLLFLWFFLGVLLFGFTKNQFTIIILLLCFRCHSY